MYSKIKKYKNELLAFFIPVIVLIFIFLCHGMIFRKNIFVSDMQAQYISLFNYFKNLLNGSASLSYSFSKGIGGGMLGTIAYYLASPINLILLFFNKSNLNIAVIIILCIKMGLSGLFMYKYLIYNHKKNSNIILLIFSTCYACMFYAVGYYINIMWLDAVYLTPLVMLGIDKIVDGKKGLLYIIALFLAILSNYYIGYMVCIFSFIYIIYKLFLKYSIKKDKKVIFKILLRYIILSLLSGLMTMFLLVPTALELLNTSKSTNDGIFSILSFNYNFLDIFKNMLYVNHGFENVLNNDSPLIYTGIINFLFLIFYFLNSKISKKEKCLSFIVILIFLISFKLNFFNYIWHGFNAPVFFNYRYSFLFNFFIITLSCKSFFEMNNNKFRHYFISFIIIIFLSVIVFINDKSYYLYINIGIMILYLLILYCLFNNNNGREKLFKIILLVLIIAELLINSYLGIRGYSEYSNKEYYDYIDVFEDNIKKIKDNDSSFYRINNSRYFTYLDSFFFNYNGSTGFISTLENNTVNFFKKSGINYAPNCFKYAYGSTKLLDSILGVKYHIVTDEKYNNYEVIDKFKFSGFSTLLYDIRKDNYYVMENPYSLSLGYMIKDSSLNIKNYLDSNKVFNYIDFQNAIVNTMIGDDIDVFKIVEYNKISDNEYEIEIQNQNDLILSFATFNIGKEDSLELYINDSLYESYNYDNISGNVNIKNDFKIGDKIKLRIVPSGSIILENDIHLFYLDNEEFSKVYKELSSNQLNIIKFSDTNIKGTIDAPKDKSILFTSIPYDKGWSVYVDGKKVKTYKVYDCFLGIKLDEGQHDIEFKYYPPGLNLGIGISCGSLVLLIVYMMFFDKKLMVGKKEDN